MGTFSSGLSGGVIMPDHTDVSELSDQEGEGDLDKGP